MRQLAIWTFVAALAIPALSQKPGDNVAQKQAALDAATKAFDDAQRDARSLYTKVEKIVAEARADQTQVWTAELARVLEPVSGPAKVAIQKKGPTVRQQLAAALKKDGPVAFKKIENPELQLLEPYLTTRLATVANEVALEAAALEPKPLAQAVLGELGSEKPVHEIWNATLADLFPAAETFRKAWDGLDRARWDLAIAKDPVMQYQRGAPPGFARVPAGAYWMLGTAGFGTEQRRKGRRATTLPKDVYIGLREVTHAEYFEWWKTLDEAGKKKHLPLDTATNQPLWPVKDPAVGNELPEEMARKPICCVTLVSAFAFAESKGARIPTEAEWCAAAGGKEGKPYPWGDAWQADACNDVERKVGDAVPVGSFPSGRGPFGHLDLAGNVAEYAATYDQGKDVDPAKIDDHGIVVRGGSFVSAKEDVSNGWVWFKRGLFERSRDVGFRLAMDVAPPAKK